MNYLPDRADELPCVADVSRRLAVREVTGEYVPSPFDALIETRRGPSGRAAIQEARELCGPCPIRDQCLADNLPEPWAQAVLGIDLRTDPTRREKCGTTAGHNAHQSHKERPCEPCKKAVNRAKARRKVELAECGTESGYKKHRRDKTRPCALCRKAHAAAERRRRIKRERERGEAA